MDEKVNVKNFIIVELNKVVNVKIEVLIDNVNIVDLINFEEDVQKMCKLCSKVVKVKEKSKRIRGKLLYQI